MTAAMKKDFSVVLHENAEAFRLLGKAAEMPDCRYSYDFKGFETLLPNAGRVGNASKLLQLKAYALVESGETAGAVRAILDNVALAKSLDRDLLIGHMTQLAFCHSCGDAAQRLLNRASPTSDQLKKLELAFKNLDSILDSMKGLKQCVVGERCGAIDLMTRPVADIKKLFAELGSTNLEGLDMDGYLQSAPFNEDFLMTLDIYENYEKAYGTPFPHNLEIYKNVEQLAGTAKDKQYYFTTMMIPALAGILDKQGVALARIRMARLAFAVEQHRLSNGGLLPEKLEQISPKLPDAELMDPFNGQSLHYQKEPRGYQISSVGVDGAGGVKRLAGADASNPNSPPSEAKSKPKTGAPAGSLLVFVVAK
ncbi:MAG TPA: hypothetical protein VFC44_00675 [Candidatus Saccharimonadales bacterium]|nr:hypothetical protein [Candidatus Saccharimonadales bacterium]